MQINEAGLEIVKHYEGLRLKSYRDPVGIWTIGYGTTTAAGVGIDVRPNMTITEQEADTYLRRALDKFAGEILPAMKREPTQNQFSAMLSLAYNIGPTAFKKSTCLRRFNAGDIEGAADALTWFNKAGGKVLRGLVRRRAAEHELFLADDVSEVVTPKADPERSSPAKSTTMQATVATAASGAAGIGTAIGALDGTAQVVLIVLGFVFAAGILWIARRRLARWIGGDR